jgi:hypothetical protein
MDALVHAAGTSVSLTPHRQQARHGTQFPHLIYLLLAFHIRLRQALDYKDKNETKAAASCTRIDYHNENHRRRKD